MTRAELPVLANNQSVALRDWGHGGKAEELRGGPVSKHPVIGAHQAYRIQAYRISERCGPMASILMIDDDGFYRGVVERELVDHGYSVVTAQNGVEGIALYRDQSPDLVITDMNMPGLDGSEVIRTVRKINSRTAIITLSGESNFHAVDYLKLAVVFGANAVVRKRDPIDRLVAEVSHLLKTAT